MEESIRRGEFQGNVGRQSSFRSGGSSKSPLSGKSTPQSSPQFRRLHSSRTPRREVKSSIPGGQWFRGNKIVLWLILITLWTYLGFYVQSRWAHGEANEERLGFGSKTISGKPDAVQTQRRGLTTSDELVSLQNGTTASEVGNGRKVGVSLAKKDDGIPSRGGTKSKKKKPRRTRRNVRGKKKAAVDVTKSDLVEPEPDPEIPKTNASYGMLVGPFGLVEDTLLEWSPKKRSGTCNRKGDFARIVWSRRFVLIFHELSMTGAPISMMDLATELLSCGATVSAIVLSKKGGLMSELARRRIKILEDKTDNSFKAAMKSDLVIAGSAVCASWIEQYIDHFPAGGSQVAWWIMENRREYFDRSKAVLNRVKMLMFLSELQSKQWLNWCEEEKIKLRSQPALIPLSVNDELAFVAGIASTLNTASFSTEKMLEKRQLLRDAVRKEMGLTDRDILVMSLSSINPGKGQLLLLESASKIIEDKNSLDDPKIKRSVDVDLKKSDDDGLSSKKFLSSNLSRRTKLLTENRTLEQSLKVLIGSVGSKSNKVDYVKGILGFLKQHSDMSKSVLWTTTTTRVASLYSASDIYVINSQGAGETFGRVTIEAMAFGLPVLGTDAGGTKEIVEHNVTGLLHPIGRPGNRVLADNLKFLLKNKSARDQMGIEGRKKVERMYLKQHMYRRFVDVLVKCMRPT